MLGYTWHCNQSLFMLINIKGNVDFVVSGVLTCLLGITLGQGYSTLVIKKNTLVCTSLVMRCPGGRSVD